MARMSLSYSNFEIPFFPVLLACLKTFRHQLPNPAKCRMPDFDFGVQVQGRSTLLFVPVICKIHFEHVECTFVT